MNTFNTQAKARFYLDGDLNQMGIQRDYLQRQNIEIINSNVYPTVHENDTKKALELIWKNNVAGWWHYKDKYVELGICTADQFTSKLMAS